jgi:hypothetical protein
MFLNQKTTPLTSVHSFSHRNISYHWNAPLLYFLPSIWRKKKVWNFSTTLLLWLRYEVSVHVEGLVSSWQCYWKVTGPWLLNGLMHWWSHNLMALLKSDGNKKNTGSASFKCLADPQTFSISLLSDCQEGGSLAPPHSMPWYFYLATGLIAMESAAVDWTCETLSQNKSSHL